MPNRTLSIIFMLIFLEACGQDEKTPTAVLETDSSVATGGNIVINVTIDPTLKNTIHVVSAVGAKPGAKKPVETTIMIKNGSAEKQSLQIKGGWYDARGNRYGGNSSTVTVAANQTRTLTFATRSTNASVYKLFLTPNIQSQDEVFAEVLSDPANKIAEGYGMTYSETAMDEIIPALPTRGFANGKLFIGKTIAFYQGLKSKWRLEISDHRFDVLKGVAHGRLERKDLQTIYINFDQEPKAGDVFWDKRWPMAAECFKSNDPIVRWKRLVGIRRWPMLSTLIVGIETL